MMNTPNIIPRPTDAHILDGCYTLTQDTNIYCNESESSIADDLMLIIRRFHAAFYGKVIICDTSTLSDSDNKSGIYLLQSSICPKEGYSIDVNHSRIIMRARDYSGFFYAYSTLVQFFSDEQESLLQLPCLHIVDAPKYSWRGLIMDVARHFFPKDEIIRLIDLLSMSKINKFTLHISNDQGFRVESKLFPLLNTVGSHRNDSQIGGFKSKRYCGMGHSGYYTQEDIREIVAYAKGRAIEVIPALELPYHSTAILASYPQLGCSNEKLAVATSFGDFHNTVCIGRDENIAMINSLVDEILGLFDSQYYNLGGANTKFASIKDCPHNLAKMAEQGIDDPHEFLSMFYNNINARLKLRGKKMILNNSAFSSYLDKDIIIQYSSSSQAADLINDISGDRTIIISSSDKYYFDYPYAITSLKHVYCSPLVPIELSSVRSDRIVGVDAALWTEWVYDREKIDFNLFPRINAVVEKCWSGTTADSYDDFIKRCRAYSHNIKPNSINFARLANKKYSFFKRIAEAYRWHNNDQYSEIRRNRKIGLV